MRKRILVPWAIPEIGKEVLTKAKAEIIRQELKAMVESRLSRAQTISR